MKRWSGNVSKRLAAFAALTLAIPYASMRSFSTVAAPSSQRTTSSSDLETTPDAPLCSMAGPPRCPYFEEEPICSGDMSPSDPTTTPCACETVTVKCNLTKDNVDGQCNQYLCVIRLPKKTCDVLGIQSGDQLNPVDIIENYPPLSTPDEIGGWCTLAHESSHACDGAIRLKPCATEFLAYMRTVYCLKHYFNEKCGTVPPAFTPPQCDAMSGEIQFAELARDYTKCLCNPCVPKSECYDRCLEAGGSFTDCDQLREAYGNK